MGELPDNFDVVVVGTGMPESIIAAAAARIGKTVLHLDRNSYYGGEWTSFSYDKFMEWVDSILNMEPSIGTPIDLVSTLASSLREGENIVTCPLRSRTITNLSFKAFVRDKPEPKEPTTANQEENTDDSEGTEENPEQSPDSDIQSEEGSNLEGNSNEQVEPESNEAGNENESEATVSPSPNGIQSRELDHELTLSYFMEYRRKFNIDLAPKLLFARGSLVELFISSNIARYAEFQCINRVLTHINGHIEQVPCSRADVFSTKNVGIVEKRMLMKFLTFCLKYEENEEEYKGFEDKPFVEFLRSKKLASNVKHYVVHAIAMVDESCTTLQGLKATQKFLESLGRYGKSPFLCTCYGSAELPQCFCRLCAVFAGTYYLQRKVEGVVFNDDEENKCKAVITSGQRIGCQWLVMESSYAPTEFYACNTPPQRISRAILITDSSLHPSEKKESTLLRLPPGPGIEHTVTVLELSSKNYVCPDDVYLVYMSCRSSHPTAEEDLKAAVNLLFQSPESESGDDKSNSKPNLLWRVFFNQRDTSTVNLNARAPPGVYLTSSPDIELDYEHAVNEAKTVFEKMFPGEEFLPRAPDPEDIVIENQNNPGEEGKIENDVTDTEETNGTEDEATPESESGSPTVENAEEAEE